MLYWYLDSNHLPYLLAYKLHRISPRISRPLKIEIICSPKSLTRV